MTNPRFKDLDIFYDFADRCEDDYEIMSVVISKYTKLCLFRIKYSLEYTRISKFLKIMKTATDDEIEEATKTVLNERANLFNLREMK